MSYIVELQNGNLKFTCDSDGRITKVEEWSSISEKFFDHTIHYRSQSSWRQQVENKRRLDVAAEKENRRSDIEMDCEVLEGA